MRLFSVPGYNPWGRATSGTPGNHLPKGTDDVRPHEAHPTIFH